MKKLSLLALTVLLLSGTTFAKRMASPKLEDVKGTLASQAVQYLSDQGIVEGYDDGNFKPEKEINRAEFLKIVLGESVKPDCKLEENYTDVKKSDWFYGVICLATEKGIVEGYPDGSFKPAKTINFAEASKIIAKVKKIELEDIENENWFEPFTRALGREKIVPRSIKNISENVNRGEMAQMIWGIDTGNEVGAEAATELEKVSSCTELDVQIKKFQKRQKSKNVGSRQFFGREFEGEMMEMDMAMPTIMKSRAMPEPVSGMSENKASVADSVTSSDKFSSTNIQEFGVDEADIIKNDGSHIYMIKDNAIRIIKAFPASSMKEVAKLKVNDKGFWPREMYVDGNILTVVGQTNENYYEKPVFRGGPEPIDGDFPEEIEFPEEELEFFDDQDIFLEDSSEDARLVESRAEVALMVMPDVIGKRMPYYPRQNKQLTTVISYDISDHANPKEIRKVSLEGNYTQSRKIGDIVYLVTNKYNNWHYGRPVPMLKESSLPMISDSANDAEKMIGNCGDIHYFPNFEESNFLIVGAINVKNTDQKVGRVMMLGSGNQIYASTKNLYVTRTQHKEKFVSDSEWDGWQWRPVTEIYKFGLDGNKINFEAKGEVDGSVLNQFSMSEKGEYFRIATQENQEGSMMNVLDGKLKLTGKVDGIAPGENIKSVRFMGNKAYMITFKNVDPLFVISLDPLNPKVLGKLKIPGWSDYLHPFDENHLIGIGREVKAGAEEDDRLTSDELLGLKLAIFDVSDVHNPKEIHKKVIGDNGTYSEALSNHKALLFDKAENIMALPITVMSIDGAKQGSYQPTKQSYNGAFVYDISLEEGFKLRGKATHYTDGYWSDENNRRWGNHEYNVQRIIYIGDQFYTISPNIIEAHSWDEVQEVNRIKLDQKACTQIYNEMECRENTQCKALWREWNECYEDSADFSKVCNEKKEFMKCETR